MAAPAGAATTRALLQPLVLVFGLGVQATSGAFWDAYDAALSDLPRLALERAIAEYLKVGKFFPKPAEVLELAERHAAALRTAAYRAKRVVEWTEPKQEDRLPPETAKALMDEARAHLAKITEAQQAKYKPRRPPPCARLAEGKAMSEEMAAHLAGAK